MAVTETEVFKDKVQLAKFFVLFSLLGMAMELVTGAAIAAFSGKALWYYPNPSLIPMFFTDLLAAPLWGFFGLVFAGVYFYYR